MEEQKQQDSDANDADTAVQLKKLTLEIEGLRRRGKWEDRIIKFSPLIAALLAALITLLGLYFTVQKDERSETLARQEREKERTNRIQSQIRADKEQILDFVNNDRISPVRVAFLLDDLKSLIGQLPESGTETEDVTKLLVDVAWQLRFDEQRHVDFDVSVLQRWAPYRQFWKSSAGSHHVFLSHKYYSPMERISSQDPSCIETLDYDERLAVFTSASASKGCQEGLFPILLYGFEERLKVLTETNDFELLRKEVEEFTRRTNSLAFAKTLSARYLTSKR